MKKSSKRLNSANLFAVFVIPSIIVVQTAMVQRSFAADGAATIIEASDEPLVYKNQWDKFIAYTDETIQNLSGKLNKTLSTINLAFQANTPSSILLDGFDPGISYRFESRSSIAGKYSGIDKWNIYLNISSVLLGLNPVADFSVEAAKEVMFIRQYDNKQASLLRLPYSPLARLPITTDVFFKKDNNGEILFKNLDFMSLRVPLTLRVSEDVISKLTKLTKLSADVDAFISGEYDLQVFRMSEDQVRVKVLDIKDKGLSINTDLVIATLVPGGGVVNFVVTRILGIRLLNFDWAYKNSNVLLADYVFNIKNPQTQTLYNKILGSKLKITDSSVLSGHVKNFNPLSSENKGGEVIFSDLKAIDQACKDDKEKSETEKRVICVNNVRIEQKSLSSGLTTRFMRFLKFGFGRSSSKSKIKVFTDGEVSKLSLVTDSSYYDTKILEIYGKSSTEAKGLLANEDKKEIVGSLYSNIRTYKEFRAKDYNNLLERLQYFLPASLFDKIMLEFPGWDFTHIKRVVNVRVREDLFIKREAYDLDLNKSVDNYTNDINEIITEYAKRFGGFVSEPAELYNKDHDIFNEKRRAYKDKYFVEAFANDVNRIATDLSQVFNSNTARPEKLKIIRKLTSDISLFTEISSFIYLKILPPGKMENLVLAQFAISGANVKPSIVQFPNAQEFQKYSAVREIMDRSDFINNRKIDLRYFIKDDGTSYGVDEIQSKNQLVK